MYKLHFTHLYADFTNDGKHTSIYTMILINQHCVGISQNFNLNHTNLSFNNLVDSNLCYSFFPFDATNSRRTINQVLKRLNTE